MSFYLLKSTNDREKIGDVIIKKENVSSIRATKVIKKEETYFLLTVTMLNTEDFIGSYNNEEEIRQVAQEICGEVFDFILSERDLTKEEKRCCC